MFCREKRPPAPKVTSSNDPGDADARGIRTNRRTACSINLLTEVPDSEARRFSCVRSRSLSVIVVRMMHDHTILASVHHSSPSQRCAGVGGSIADRWDTSRLRAGQLRLVVLEDLGVVAAAGQRHLGEPLIQPLAVRSVSMSTINRGRPSAPWLLLALQKRLDVFSSEPPRPAGCSDLPKGAPACALVTVASPLRFLRS
jgi:hypothetical protein